MCVFFANDLALSFSAVLGIIVTVSLQKSGKALDGHLDPVARLGHDACCSATGPGMLPLRGCCQARWDGSF